MTKMLPFGLKSLRPELRSKIERLRERQSELVNRIEANYNDGDFRELSMVNHRIEIAEARNNGEWFKPTPELVSMPRVVK